MSATNTIAIIGTIEKNIVSLIEQIAKLYHIVLFNKEENQLKELQSLLASSISKANIEVMNCVTNASWEADIIFITDSCRSNQAIANKIRKVSTGKIIVLLSFETKPTANNTILQELLPNSKIITSILSETNQNEIHITGNDAIAKTTIASYFKTIGRNTKIDLTPISN